jgi:hypothetical protein
MISSLLSLAEFGQDYFAWMHKHDPQHTFTKGRVEPDGFAKEVINAGYGFHTGEAAPSYHKGEQRLSDI